MIPKVIHYCWFGGNPLPESAVKCIESWRKYNPEYEIKRWDENNFELDVRYAREAYKAKKWAFVSDYARLKIVYEYGGIYLDTDVEVIKPLDPLLFEKAFLGSETDGFVATGLGFGAEKNNPVIKKLLSVYQKRRFTLSSKIYDQTSCPRLNTPVIQELGFVFSEKEIWRCDEAAVYPPDFFCPMNYKTGKMNITDRTYSIHHFSASWVTNQNKEIEEAVAIAKEKYKGIRYIIEIQKAKFRIAKKYEGINNYFLYVDHRIRKRIVYFLMGW